MRIRESRFNTELKTGAYGSPIHHGEVVKGSTVRNDAPSALGQNLAGPEGHQLAQRLFAARRKKS